MEPLDHKNIDLDVPFFLESGMPSTTENVAVFIFNGINERIGNKTGVKLYEVKIWETKKNIVVYRG